MPNPPHEEKQQLDAKVARFDIASIGFLTGGRGREGKDDSTQETRTHF